ncbi:MAG: NUDIX hydrolase [Thermoanaerobaculia bacterium]
MRQFDTHAIARLRKELKTRPADQIDLPLLKRASVMIPLIPIDGGWQLLFSRRSPELSVHSGQISFPGGGVTKGEAFVDAAIREMEEEVGIDRSLVEIIGRLDDVVTRSGFIVAPFVGILATRPEYVLQESEVDEIFEVPIETLLAEGNPEIRHVDFKGLKYPAYFYRTEQMEIWGLTGRILKAFLDVVRLTV